MLSDGLVSGVKRLVLKSVLHFSSSGEIAAPVTCSTLTSFYSYDQKAKRLANPLPFPNLHHANLNIILNTTAECASLQWVIDVLADERNDYLVMQSLEC